MPFKLHTDHDPDTDHEDRSQQVQRYACILFICFVFADTSPHLALPPSNTSVCIRSFLRVVSICHHHLATTTSHHPRTRARTHVFAGGFHLPPPPSNHLLPPPSDMSTHARYRGWWLFATTPPPGTHYHLLPPSDMSTDARF